MVGSTTRVLVLLVLGGAAGAASFAQQSAEPTTCSLAFDSTVLNAQTNRGEFRGIRLTCEGVAVAADEAEASEVVPQEGQWEMHGNVRIESAAALITADSATLGFAASNLLFGELSGVPAVLEDRGTNTDGTLRARATAQTIYYDNVAQTARLRMREGNSLVGPNFEMRGCGDISYDLATGESESIATCGDPLEIRYLRPSDGAQEPGQAPPNDE
ncbi:MAG TPA: hypothetical protein VIC71_03350 [Gammaproteobacteria bacterium]